MSKNVIRGEPKVRVESSVRVLESNQVDVLPETLHFLHDRNVVGVSSDENSDIVEARRT